MSLRGDIRARAIELYLGQGTRKLARGWHRLVRNTRGQVRRATFFFRVDNPQCHLVSQVLPRIAEAYGLEVELVVVPAPAADVDPEPGLKAEFDVVDARNVAEALGLSFPAPGSEPVATRVRLANAVLLVPREPTAALDLAYRVSDLLLRRDGDGLAALAEREGSVSGQDVRPTLEANYARLRRTGHYQPGVVVFEGEHYLGVDRLRYLEDRLRAEGLDAGAELAPRARSEEPGPEARGRTVEVFFSFRSPYSYLALARLVAWRDVHGVDVRARPVLPLVMRGLPVPAEKRLYLARDAKREADRLGIPFGRIADPVGVGVERCIAVFAHADARGRGLDFAHSACKGAFADGLDLATDAGLFAVAARAGVDEATVRAGLADEGWRTLAERNREELYDLGLWGVPSFRIGDFSTFGQDRLFLVAARLRER